jgi:signal transduction histidine kinase
MATGAVSWTVSRFRLFGNWWRTRDPLVRDLGIALVLAVLAFVPTLSIVGTQFGDLPTQPADALTVLLTLGLTLPLAVRTRWPAGCLAITGISFAIHEALGYPHTFGSLGLCLALFAVGSHQDLFRRSLPVGASAAFLAWALILHLLGSPDRMVDFVLFYLTLTACWVMGAFVRRHRAEEAQRRRSAAAAATAAERARIARELHDVVTHHVTAMVVQADAAQFLTESPERVIDGLTAISGTGREALVELRYLLGVLEATGEATPARRMPTLGTLADLTERTRLGGQPVELIEEGDKPPMAVGEELAAYRVVQEALTNAVKHASGQRTLVRVRYGHDRIDIEVTTDGPAVTVAAVPVSRRTGSHGGSGRGLDGLRERVGMLGGELVTGSRPDGGFRVHALIPTGSDA